MQNLQNSSKLLIVLSFAAIYLIWGTTYLIIAIGLEELPPFLMASLRFIIAGVMLIGYCLIKKEKLPSTSSILKNTFLGLIVLVGGQGLLIWSEQYIATGYASILVATLPIWFVIIDKSNWKIYFSNPYIIMGVVLGFLGILLLFQDTLNSSSFSNDVAQQLYASAAVLLGAVCWVFGTLYNRTKPAPGSIYSNLGWQLLMASLICVAISYSTGELSDFNFAHVTYKGWLSVIYLSVAGSIIAFITYTWLLTKMPSAIVGTYAYINPVVAVVLGWYLADEVISNNQLIGMAVILGSAILVNITRSQVQSKNHEEEDTEIEASMKLKS
ncbi:EamA family transporter [Fulvivirga sp. 29W222]|uniref:EamA family transporter n=1 Tax=Fulvivirga marina TaxID=2494733 RepID=A0A937FW82_9BACT|nr:EamA family transporter [Fulvivirga marina]MBL6445628.1 EamA family transporter [Fulvivirga marina]